MAPEPSSLVADAAGLRLDQFLASRVPGYSRAFFKKLVESGRVSVDGGLKPPDYRLRGGEHVSVRWGEREWPEFPFEDWVLHEDKRLLVLRKPAGLLMHPLGESWVSRPEAALEEKEPNLAGLLLKHRPASSALPRCGLLHRLDRQTSGVLAVAKEAAIQEELLEAFRERLVRKRYRAIVLGELGPVKVEAPVGRIAGMRRVRAMPWGRPASTQFRVVEKGLGVALVEAEPLTGRTHQIRAHLSFLGHPVLGDPELKPSVRAAFEAGGRPWPARMMLHAYRLTLPCPRGKETTFTAPLPTDFRSYWRLLKSAAKNDKKGP